MRREGGVNATKMVNNLVCNGVICRARVCIIIFLKGPWKISLLFRCAYPRHMTLKSRRATKAFMSPRAFVRTAVT